jgi:M6 family metalloprotease-like protein
VEIPDADHIAGVTYSVIPSDVADVVTVTPLADTTVDSGAAGANAGDRDFVEVGRLTSTVPQASLESWLAFGLSSIPESATIESATLRLYTHSPPLGQVPAEMLVAPALASWDEETLTWQNRPPLGAAVARPVTAEGDQWIELNLDPLVRDWVRGAIANHGLALQPSSSPESADDWLLFLHSRDDSQAPELQVRYSLAAPAFVWKGTVRVRATTGEEEPVHGVEIGLYASENSGQIGARVTQTSTDSQGRFSLSFRPDVEDAYIQFTVRMDDTDYRAVGTVPGIDGISLTEGEIRYADIASGLYSGSEVYLSPVRMPDSRNHIFAGRVFDIGASEPAANVEIIAYGAEDPAEPEQILGGASSGADGSFRLLVPYATAQPFANLVIMVADLDYQAEWATPGPGASPRGTRIVYESPHPGTHAGIEFEVGATAIAAQLEEIPDRSVDSAHVVEVSAEYRPTLAVMLLPRCTCAITKCTTITNPMVLTAFGDTLFDAGADSVNGYYLENSQRTFGLQQIGLFMVQPMDVPATGSIDESLNCTLHDFPGGPKAQRAYVVRHVLGQQLQFNFAAYDSDADGIVEADELLVVLAMTDPHSGNARAWPSNPSRVQVGGVGVELRYALVQAGTDFYTIAHEIAHTLPYRNRSGMPVDQYGGSGNAGRYSLMDNHCWARTDPPPNVPWNGTQRIGNQRFPHFDPWNKIEFGWVDVKEIIQPGWMSLSAVQRFGDVWKIAISGRNDEYFLVENRWSSGSQYETQLGTEGLAIWHIKEKYLPDVRRAVQLERAGSGANSGAGTNFCDDDGDTTALWDGKNSFDRASTYNSDWDDGTQSNVAVTCISAPGKDVDAYFDIDPDGVLFSDGAEPNNGVESAVPISLGPVSDLTIAAACDQDWFTFSVKDYETLTAEASAYLDGLKEQPTSGPKLTLWQDHQNLAIGTSSLTYQLPKPGANEIQTEWSDKIYYDLNVATTLTEIKPDRYDDQIFPNGTGGEPRNDTKTDATHLLLKQHTSDRIQIPGLIEIGGTGGGNTEDDLNFHLKSDVDFFKIQIDPHFEYAKEFGAECPTGPPAVGSGYEAVTSEKAYLKVWVDPDTDRPFDIALFDSKGKPAPVSPQIWIWSWGVEIECPLSLFPDGIVLVSLRDASGNRNLYDMTVDYQESYLLARDPNVFGELHPIVELKDTEFLLPLDPGPYHRFFPDDVKLIDRCLGGECPTDLPADGYGFVWPAQMDFRLDLTTSAGSQLRLSLSDSKGQWLADLPQSAQPSAAQLTDEETRTLQVAKLNAGLYFLEIDGDRFGIPYVLEFAIGDDNQIYLPMVTR